MDATNVFTLKKIINYLKKTDADIMTDVNVKSWSWYLPYIYGETGWRITGDAIKTRDN